MSAIQQSESVVCIHISLLFKISFPFKSPQSIEQSSLSETEGSQWLPVLHIASVLYICQSQSSLSSQHPAALLSIHLFSMSLSLSLCFANKIIYTVILDSTHLHYCMIFVFFFLAYFTLYNSLQVYSHLYKWHICIPFSGWGMFQSGLSWWLSGEEAACSAGGIGLIPGQEGPLEKEMAAHSSVLAGEIPWTEEPGGLQSMWSERIRHNLATKQQ